MNDTTARERLHLSTAIARVRELEADQVKIQDAQSRARDEVADLDAQLISKRAEYELARREAPRLRALAYADDGSVEERDMPVEAAQTVLDELTGLHARYAEIAATLDSELAACQRRLDIAQRAVTSAAAAVIEASPEFHALLESVTAAWANLRTRKIALDTIVKACRGNASDEAYKALNRSEPLVRDIVGFPWDEKFVDAWEHAVERLAQDADASLPGSDV